jgi:hypothetical protein
VASPAAHTGTPRYTVTDAESLSLPVCFQTVAQLFDHANSFVSQNNRAGDRQLALPQVNVRAAHACHLNPDQSGEWFDHSGQRKLTDLKGFVKARHDRGSCCFDNSTSRGINIGPQI